MPRIGRLLLGCVFLALLCTGCTYPNTGLVSTASSTVTAISTEKTSSDDSANAVYLTNCRLINGTGAPPVPNAVVVFADGILTKVGTGESIAIPKGSKQIDLNGATVMPGFINAHVHSAYNEKNLETWLKAGVTTVRDEAPRTSGDFLTQRDRLNKVLANAKIVSATPILSVPGGYGGDPFDSADAAVKKVEQYMKAGVDIIKISIEDDLQGRTWKMPTYEEIKAVVDTAHAGGRKVSAHISHERNLQWAIDAGVDDIAHMVVEPIDKQTVEQMVQKGIYWVPTLELWNGVSKDYSLDWVDVAMANLSVFYKAGGKVALGTDFAGYTITFDTGFPVTEVNLMKQAGMTPMDIIVAGTRNAAHVCGLDGTLGTVEPGKIADLLVVNSDPLSENWSSGNPFSSVRMVVHGGQIVVDNAP